MSFYIKFDASEEEDQANLKLNSCLRLFDLFKTELKLKNSTFAIFETLPNERYNEELRYHPYDAGKEKISLFFQKNPEKTKFGVELNSKVIINTAPAEISFLLLPDGEVKKEMPDLAISVIPDVEHPEMIEPSNDITFKNTLAKVIQIYQNQDFGHFSKEKRLRIRKAILTFEDELYSPKYEFNYYLYPREFFVDFVRYAKKHSLQNHLDLISEQKFGAMIFKNEVAREQVNRLYAMHNIKIKAGSLIVIPESSERAFELYKDFEKNILKPVAEAIPTRAKLNAKLSGIKNNFFEKQR